MNKDDWQKFSIDMDARSGNPASATDKDAAEYLELLELGEVLARQDFSQGSNKAAVLLQARNRVLTEQEEPKMSIRQRIKRPAMIVASLLAAGIVSISFVRPSFAQEMLVRALNTINLGHIIASEMDPNYKPEFPEAWKGKMFDKDGHPITSFNHKLGTVFNAEGERIVNFDGDKLITQSEQEKLDKEQAARIFAVKDPAELDKYALFRVKLPEYLPEGFAFDHGEFYKGEEGVNGQVVELFFTSEQTGKRIWMQLRLSNKDNAYEMSTSGKMEQVELNGVDAVMMNERTLDWEANGVLYDLSTHGLDRAEVLKIAESIRW
ncbi:DUF4367 domain-containing protein [Paenibacillus sp. FSL R7-0312]|uniref:DUF4367 domain-containing protein n=1 Tax=Paenibacillus sp. FSL R7-0312 TaxID=2921682 RepID=UPI0030F9DFD2